MEPHSLNTSRANGHVRTLQISSAASPVMHSRRKKRPTNQALKAATPGTRGDDLIVPLLQLGPEGPVARDVVIEGRGERDLVLQVQEYGTTTELYYLVSSAVLRQASSYFRVLLDPAKFSEGVDFDSQLKTLTEKHVDLGGIRPECLPRIKITDLGQLPSKTKVEAAVTTYLCILHDPNLSSKFPGLHCLAMVAIIADRFDTTGKVVNQLNRGLSRGCWRDMLADINPYEMWGPKEESSTRQLLLIGLLLKTETQKFKQHSANLIIHGSERWNTDTACRRNIDALWWKLPNNLEEELMCRREYLLDTIGSIPTYFIKLYTFQPNQCRLGYDTSPACNSFQLGETIRFFVRKGTLSLQNTIFPTEQPTPWEGDIDDLIASLRQCPSYQIDSNHMHCGPRNRLVIALDTIKPFPNVGVCFQCWQKDASAESWLESPSGGKWAINTWKPGPVVEPQGCGFHRKAKAMFTAEERGWTATP